MNRDVKLSAEILLKQIKTCKLSSSLVEITAMLRGRLGRHKEAIEELLRVKSVQDAETYCLRNDILLTEDADDKITQPMIVLLSVLFRPVESYVFFLSRALITHHNSYTRENKKIYSLITGTQHHFHVPNQSIERMP